MQIRKTKATRTRKRSLIKRRTGMRARGPEAKALAHNTEELLLRRVLEGPRGVPTRSLQIQDIVYSSAPELRVLAFKSGYNLGAEAYRKSARGIGVLQRLLDNAGFGKVVYYPFESRSTFASRAVRHGGQDLGINLHVFESGIISGYLSAHAGQSVVAEEASCVFNGASNCTFLAKPGTLHANLRDSLEFSSLLHALKHSIEHAEPQSGWHGYYVLETAPLFAEPVFSETLRFLYLLGKLAATSHLPRPEHEVVLASRFVGFGSAKVQSTKERGTSILLAYKPETSVGRFVDLTSAFMSGVVKGAYGRNVRVSRSVSARGIYNVKMEVLEDFKSRVA